MKLKEVLVSDIMKRRYVLALICIGQLLFLCMFFKVPQHTKSALSEGTSEFDAVIKSVNRGATGKVFSGVPFREFTSSRMFEDFPRDINRVQVKKLNLNCHLWAVLTTINFPGEAVRQFLYKTHWCLVVVGDWSKPTIYELPTTIGENIIFLSKENQTNTGLNLITYLPWNSFGRKNVGYLYAIANGAQQIWDFDDDNYFKFWLNGAAPDPFLEVDTFVDIMNSKDNIRFQSFTPKEDSSFISFNPYPVLGCPKPKCWPRGLPLDHIRQNSTHRVHLTNMDIPGNQIAVFQSLADHEPDVDAVHRMVMQTPWVFKKPLENQNKPLVVPASRFSPYNAQATLHNRNGFFALYLPVSVNGRVSDIWRSYFAQALFRLCDLKLGFIKRPIVVQDRNPHSYEADFEAELPLYRQTSQLLAFLNEWVGTGQEKLVQRPMEFWMEDLYIQAYQRGYIEIEDVQAMQQWIIDLQWLDYEFPRAPGSQKARNNRIPTTIDVSRGQSVGQDGIKIQTDLLSTVKTRRFWTSDLHKGCKAYLASVLPEVHQKVLVVNRKGWNLENLSAFNGKGVHVYKGDIPPVLQAYATHTTSLSPYQIKRTLELIKPTTLNTAIDAYFCSFPSSMCEMWMPWNATKSIFFVPAHRYNLGRCSLMEWKKLNYELETLHSNPRHVIAALSLYDKEYLNYYTGYQDLEILNSYSGFYTQPGVEYKGKRPEIPVIGTDHYPTSKNITQELTTALTEFEPVPLIRLYPKFTFQDLANHRAIIFVPYSVMSFKFTEVYSLSIPIFVPSPKFFRANGGMGRDRTSTSPFYCNKPELDKQMPKHPKSTHPYSPNTEFEEDPEAEMYWLQFSDFYTRPYVQTYDSGEDLQEKLQTLDLLEIHEKMVKENDLHRRVHINTWIKLLLRTGETH